jgi:thiol-disulfide isomerase/thioredoxin
MPKIRLLALFLIVSLFTKAQTKLKPEDLTVKDSTGMIYPTIIWQKLLQSGKYTLKSGPEKTTVFLVALTDEQYAEKMAKIPKPGESRFFTTGAGIAAFSEKDINGVKFSLKDLKAAGKVVVLNFWFVNCPPCRQEIPQLNELVSFYKDKPDVVFIAVALDDKYAIEEFTKGQPFNYHIIDNARYIALKYGITLYPTHAVLNKEGKVIFHTSGLALNTVDWVKKSIEAALHDTVPR